MNSAIFTCEVKHARVQPIRHELRYPLYMYAIDLDELPELDKTLPLFGYNRFRPVSIRDRDHLDDGPGTIREKLVRRLRGHGLPDEPSQIILITNAAYFGYVFNPVSFYYCFNGREKLMACVAEVNNTFGDRHLYIFTGEGSDPAEDFLLSQKIEKAFHVSPFNRVEGHYQCRFADIRRELNIHVDLYKAEKPVMYASIQGKGVPMTPANHAGLILKHPFTPWLTMPRIVWEALKLMCKKMVMNPSYLPSNPMTIKTRTLNRIQRFCMRKLDKVFRRLHTGRLDVEVRGIGSQRFGDENTEECAKLVINAPGFFTRVARGGDVGFGEAFMKGEWDSPDVTTLLKLFINNSDVLNTRGAKPGIWAALANRVSHARRRNSLPGSRRNIREHYDLGNDFFRRFLDPTMTYSCGLYQYPDNTLEQAQTNKLDAVIDKAMIGPEHHVLEIGCGWASFAIRAVKRTGCRVTGITISDEQRRLARERVREAGLEDRVTIELQDYRTMTGSFDRIVSIEMLEAVGHRNLGVFFDRCDKLLAQDGLVVLQVITIPDQRYAAYRNRGDWIQKHIFPGGVLPSLNAISNALTERTPFIIEDIENIGVHYARTLAEWRERFMADEELGREFKQGSLFHRKWFYYFCYCEAGFATRTLDDLHIVLTRPNNRSLPGPPRPA